MNNFLNLSCICFLMYFLLGCFGPWISYEKPDPFESFKSESLVTPIDDKCELLRVKYKNEPGWRDIGQFCHEPKAVCKNMYFGFHCNDGTIVDYSEERTSRAYCLTTFAKGEGKISCSDGKEAVLKEEGYDYSYNMIFEEGDVRTKMSTKQVGPFAIFSYFHFVYGGALCKAFSSGISCLKGGIGIKQIKYPELVLEKDGGYMGKVHFCDTKKENNLPYIIIRFDESKSKWYTIDIENLRFNALEAEKIPKRCLEI